MNDKFRFRVWFTPDYQEPEMIYDAEQTYDNRCRNEGSFYHESFGEILEDKNCIVMQCTGLKDKNGKLIYEGDILGGMYCGYIAYCDECKCFQLHFREYGCMACEGDVHWYELVESEEENELEVVGNIYENPELLEGNNG